MNKTVGVVNLSASICSLIAFIVLVFEKANIFSFSFAKLIQYTIFTVYILMIGSLMIYGFLEFSKMIKEYVSNILLIVASFSFVLILIILFAIFFVMLGNVFILGFTV